MESKNKYVIDGVEYDVNDKPSNPKDVIGANKLPLSIVPATTKALLTLGHIEGHLKYGLMNWREAGVRYNIYRDALDRHMAKLDDGQWADPVSHVPHLGNALACLSIISDAAYAGKLIDTRSKPLAGYPEGPNLPKVTSVADLIDELAEVVMHLKNLYGDKKPVDYYIDGPKQRE